MTWKTGDRVQDEAGMTGTVTDELNGDIEVTWDISGCCSDLHESDVGPEQPGFKDRQDELHRINYGTDLT